MRVLLKIFVNICIIILAFFLGRVSNVCVTNSDCKNLNSNCTETIDVNKQIEKTTEDSNNLELIDVNGNDKGILDTTTKYLEDDNYIDSSDYNTLE